VALHAGLTPERWAGFSLDQQLLMVANELNRAGKLAGPGEAERLRRSYERALELTDLTVAAHAERGLRRELLRWRDLVAALCIAPAAEPAAHAAALRALLQFTPVTARQIPWLVAPAGAPPDSR
jgi:hypothetical protein